MNQMYSQPNSSNWQIVSALIIPRSATTQIRPTPNRRCKSLATGTKLFTSAVFPGHR
jgi:hypothetical protein